MSLETIPEPITLEILAKAIASLDFDQATKLRQILDDAIADLEEDFLEEDNLEIQAEIEAAKQAYEVGDYLTLDEYTKKRTENLR